MKRENSLVLNKKGKKYETLSTETHLHLRIEEFCIKNFHLHIDKTLSHTHKQTYANTFIRTDSIFMYTIYDILYNCISYLTEAIAHRAHAVDSISQSKQHYILVTIVTSINHSPQHTHYKSYVFYTSM